MENRLFEHNISSWEKEPPIGHKNRFEEKLDNRFHRNQTRLIRFQSLTIAASIIVVVAVSLVLMIRLNQFNNEKMLFAGKSAELKETELYYRATIENRLDTLKQRDLVNQELIADLQEIDKNLKNVNRDLKINPGDERVVETILLIYQTKLELINEIIHRSEYTELSSEN